MVEELGKIIALIAGGAVGLVFAGLLIVWVLQTILEVIDDIRHPEDVCPKCGWTHWRRGKSCPVCIEWEIAKKAQK